MKKPGPRVVLAAASLLLLLAGAYVVWPAVSGKTGAYESGLPVQQLVVETAAGKEYSFNVELAEKPIDIEIGLMHRKSMPADHGMLFLFDTPRETSFWMKNTLIPLDMLFIAPNGEIANIHHNARPQSLDSVPSRAVIIAVLEINGGRARALGIGIGDRVLHPRLPVPPAR